MTLIHIQVMPGYLDPISKTPVGFAGMVSGNIDSLYSRRKQVSISKVIRE